MRAVLALIAACASISAVAQDKLKVATFPSSSSLPYYVAVERGYFKEAGIETESVPMTSHPFIVQALVKGDIDAAAVLVTLEGANINQRRPGTLAYININGQNHVNIVEQFVVKADHPARTLKDLKGTRILSAPGPANIGAARAVLKSIGLEEGKDFSIQEQQMGVHIGALQAGTFDAGYTLEPVASMMIKQGIARRLEAGVISTYLLGRKEAQSFAAGGVVSGKLLAEQPALAARYARALAKGLADASNDPKARELLSKYMNVPADIAPTVPLARYTMVKDLSAQDLTDFQKFIDIGVEQKVVAGPIEAKSFLKAY
jgi:NitT/TauT family transport system substrate-binding protein